MFGKQTVHCVTHILLQKSYVIVIDEVERLLTNTVRMTSQ